MFTYDAFGRTKRIHPENPPTPEADVVFTYGAANASPLSSRGRRIRVDDDEGYELFGPLGNLREIDSVPVGHAHPEKPHWPSAQGGLPIEADAEGAIASRTVGATAQPFTHDSLGRPRQTGNLVHGYDWTGRRLRTWQAGTPANEAILEPEPGYSYEAGLVNKHFFVAGRRVAASAKTWTAPSASAPVLWAGPRLPLPPPWLWGVAYAGALGGLLLVAARRRPLGAAPRGLRFGAVAVLATVAPTLIVG